MKKRFFATITTILIALLFLSFASLLSNHIYPLKYYNIVEYNAKNFKVDTALVFAIIKAESKFNKNAVSYVGAVGLMQLMPETADFIATKVDYNQSLINLKDPETNIYLGVAYLSYLQNKFTNIDAVICAYNAGEGEVATWLNKKGKLKTIKFAETETYLYKVKTALNVYKEKIKFAKS